MKRVQNAYKDLKKKEKKEKEVEVTHTMQI
jgi:hypothetical protein